jgi:hypothetical protein
MFFMVDLLVSDLFSFRCEFDFRDSHHQVPLLRVGFNPVVDNTSRHNVDLLPGDRYGAILLIDFAYGNLHRLTVCKLPGKRFGQARSSLFSASH